MESDEEFIQSGSAFSNNEELLGNWSGNISLEQRGEIADENYVYAEFELPDDPEYYMNDESADEDDDEYSSDENENEIVRGSDEAVLTRSPEAVSPSKNSAAFQPVDIQWTWTPTTSHRVNVEPFDETLFGWKHTLDSDSSPLSIFQRVFGNDALTIVVEETNRYADQTGNCLTKRWENWKSVDESETLRFLGVRMLMGLNSKPEISNQWSKDPIFRQDLIPQIMSRDRYFEISKNLHFANNEDQVQGDRLFKINNIWNNVMQNFGSLLTPHEKISVDESLILYKGRLYFKQYIPSKRSRFGVKTFTAVDEKTKFILKSIIYSGKGHNLTYSKKEYGYGGAIALELMTPYLHQNRHLYADNWFTSPLLAKSLLDRKTYMCGTLRKSRKNTPAVQGKIKPGEVQSFVSNDILLEYWKDKKIVRMISTANNNQTQDVPKKNSTETTKKPLSVLDYNKNARGIDQSDMLMKFYSLKRKSLKWYRKIFFHIMDMCVYNSFVIFKFINGPISYLEFKIRLTYWKNMDAM